MEIISLKNVTKTFGNYTAVDDLSMSILQGKIFGLLGPNGAGKTTTIRMINNILEPDSGDLTVFGEKAGPGVQNRIGYLPEERGLYKKLKVLDQLIYFGQLKGLEKNEAKKRARYWLEKMGSRGWESKKIQELSKGMQQKVQFISTILHEPDLLILDEPFSGFDPINTELLKNIILDLESEGRTIVLSTHVMSQVEQLCDDMCLINKGAVVLSGNVKEVKKSYGKDTIIIEYEGDGSFVEKLPEHKVITRSDNRLEIRLANPDIPAMDIVSIVSETAILSKFEQSEPTLHEIFIDVVGKENLRKEDENE
jgi:ABC-2 type transport system ATP-binding protein